jgi:hypothetical protein
MFYTQLQIPISPLQETKITVLLPPFQQILELFTSPYVLNQTCELSKSSLILVSSIYN